MSKIAIFDPYLRKFTGDMERALIKEGHEVRMDRYYNPEWVNEWADIIWFDTCDNNLASATNPSHAILDDNANYQPWDMHEMDMASKQVIVRPIDIEVWQGHQNAAIWDLVDDVIFIAPHIRELAMGSGLPGLRPIANIHTIPCGIDRDRYKFRRHEPGFNIAVISEKWTSKGTDLILQIALKLRAYDKRYKIHWLGRWSDYDWEKAYFDDFIKHHDLQFEFTEWLEGDDAVDLFLEDKNYLLHASHKEAFSYATAEAMAKGIKPVIHNFYGCKELWPDLPTWDSIDQAFNMLTVDFYETHDYPKYLSDHGLTLPQMMGQINRVMNLNN